MCTTHTGFGGSRGYDIVLAANQVSAGNDFGNGISFRLTGGMTGEKFNDVAGNGIRDAGDPPLGGIVIHLFDKATDGATVHQHSITDALGHYEFLNLLSPGEYIVCEEGGPPEQTFPAADASGGLCAAHTGIAGSRGYDITLDIDEISGGHDFGNHPIPKPPIPTLSGYGLIALTLLFGLAGMAAVRRRRGQGPIAR